MLTLPNLLTLSRIFAVPLLAFLLWWPDWRFGYGVGFVVYCLIGFTDYLDGYLARAQGAANFTSGNQIANCGLMAIGRWA